MQKKIFWSHDRFSETKNNNNLSKEFLVAFDHPDQEDLDDGYIDDEEFQEIINEDKSING